MGFMVQIEESKIDKIAAYAEKMLRIGGKMMQCIEEMDQASGMGHRGGSEMGNRYNEGGSMGERGGYGNREEEDPEIEAIIRERRRRSSRTGRFM